jgi:hypothetical protein
MFGHSGWCATLEDRFDPRRVNQGYIPTGFKLYNAKTYAMKGHPYYVSQNPVTEFSRKQLGSFSARTQQ